MSARCKSCARLRQLLAGTLLVTVACLGLRAASLPGAPASAAAPPSAVPAAAPVPAAMPASMPASVPASVPVAGPAPAASQPAAPAVAASTPQPAASSADMQLVFRTVALPSGRRGQAYGPHQVVRDGVPPYRVLFNGRLPPGLVLGDDGVLRGTPTATGAYRFTLLVLDTAHPQQGIEQPYVLYVNPPASQAARPAAAPASAAAPPRPTLRSLAQADIDLLADPHLGQPLSYKLTPKQLETLVPEEPAAATEPPAQAGEPPVALAAIAEPVAPAPTAAQLRAVLEPVIDVEYPTLALFQAALDNGRCDYYQRHLLQAAQQHGLQADTTCPPPPPPRQPATARPGAAVPGVSLHRFYEGLLEPATREQLIRLAEQRHPFGSTALRVDGGGCGCAPQRSEDEVIGFLPYWTATDAPLTVDFSLFTRLAFMGAVLGDDGSWTGPPGWDGRGGGNFAREARRHGTRADLVLYRRDWASLLRLPPEQADGVARSAARNAVLAADVRHADLSARLSALLLPGWRESPYLYDGLTVFFEDAPAEGPQERAYARFLKLFLHELVAAMRKSGRAYQINIVVPERRLRETGAYNFSDLMDVLKSAEEDLARIIQKTDRKAYGSPTGLSVAFLLLMDGPIPSTLRTRIDSSPSLVGDSRRAFLESVVPVLQHRRGDAPPAELPPPQQQALHSDMATIQWNYGGVGLWPAPGLDSGVGRSVQDVTRDVYARSGGTLGRLCDFACPNRLPLRLLYQALMLTLLAGTALYIWDCRVRRFGRRYLIALWVGALATLGTALLVFSCDPALAQARDQGYGLYALILLLIAAAGYVTFKPRVGVP
jgi:hypothetical protein